MIDRNLFSIFEQNGDSCIMATYAIGAGYFTKKPVEYYFKAYCKHYCLPCNASSAEEVYNIHFCGMQIGAGIGKERNGINGYQMIEEDLHNRSNVQAFKEARESFDVKYLPHNCCRDKQILDRLENEETCLCTSYRVIAQQGKCKRDGAHSVVVAFDSRGLYYIDTRKDSLTGISHVGPFDLSVSDWPDYRDEYISSICDGLMLSKTA